MPAEIRTCFLPVLSQPEEFSGSVAVILDILRASSTMTYALNSGAEAIIPCQEIDEARALAEQMQSEGEQVLLGGERGGIQIEGFDLDNSPARYPAEVVGGKQIVFTTSNGTRALKRAIQARRILIGAFINLDVLLEILRESDGLIYLVCAGTDGVVTGEDCLCAGAIAAELVDQCKTDLVLDDCTRILIDHYRTQIQQPDGLLQGVRASLGGRNLIRRGFEEDIRLCSQRGLISRVPEFNHQTGLITFSAG
ncbi:2-phosphosulfolactate phosphatase [Gimesia panareensis]|uniref:2-phosphosulfolactate phosphatase n=1 Tax=Gimesia panareensis TaxID=2527978 RepID=UPI0011A88849|nr:2-phosphosulfolactate phosphatase [Gimesia panareensis]